MSWAGFSSGPGADAVGGVEAGAGERVGVGVEVGVDTGAGSGGEAGVEGLGGEPPTETPSMLSTACICSFTVPCGSLISMLSPLRFRMVAFV